MESDTRRGNVHNAPHSSLKSEVLDDDFCNVFSSSSSLSSPPLQDFHHLDHHFPLIKAPPFDTDIEAFDSFFHGFDLYEDSSKLICNYDDHGAMQSSFQGGGSLMEMDTASNSINHQNQNMNQNHPNPKPLSILVPDENSCITTDHFRKNGKCSTGNNGGGSESSKKAAVGRRKAKSGKGQWTLEEDRVLMEMVEKYGEKKWSRIAQLMKGRIGKQCRERWHNHLRPDIKKDMWTEEEDRILIEAHAEMGNKWAEIAKRLAGRTENSIKNHWNATKRRQLSRRKCRTKWPTPSSLLQNYIKTLHLPKCSSSSSRSSNTTTAADPSSTADHHIHIHTFNVDDMEFNVVQDYHEIDHDVPDLSFMDADFVEAPPPPCYQLVELPFHTFAAWSQGGS